MTALGEEAISDAELVRTIGKRSSARSSGIESGRKAEAELCRRFAPRIRLYGLRHLGDEDRARDLVQAVLLGVLVAARADRIDDPDRIDRFVLGTCRNVAQRMRDLASRATLALDEELDVAPLLQEVEFVETGALVRCVSRLDLRGRRVVTMSFLEERSADEIARALETTAGNVRVLRHRAIAALRRCLDGAETSDGAKSEPARGEDAAPFDGEAGEVLIACQRHFSAFPPNVVFEVRSRDAARIETLAVYEVPHVFA